MQLTATAQLPQHKALARESVGCFSEAEAIVSQHLEGMPGVQHLEVAADQARHGVKLLEQAYDSIPSDGYDSGNLALTTGWANAAIADIEANRTVSAARMLDEIIERIQNDFDL